jgi:succinate dehydrogenase / fumarate reductase cytochrome b subunit
MEHKESTAPVATGLTLNPEAIDEKYHFLLRKLHSLSGIIPIGVFLIEHLLTNSLAFAGRDKFNKAVHGLHDLPYLLALEVFGIFLPIAFHALYGIKIAMSAEPNTHAYPYMANRRYLLQRVTGYIAFVFLIVHLLKFRFAHLIGWGPQFIGSADPYELTRNGLLGWHISQLNVTVPAAVTIAFYVIGLWAACYHFANGIWSFCISWGITVGEQAQKRVGVVAALVGITLFAWGSLSLYAFATHSPSGEQSPSGKSSHVVTAS